MDFEHARSVVLNFPNATGYTKNTELLGLIAGDRDIFDRVHAVVIFHGLPEDKDSVGLIYRAGKTDQGGKWVH